MTIELENKIYATFLEDVAQGYLQVYKVDDKHLESATYLISMLPEQALRTLNALHLAIAQSYQVEHITLLAKAAQQLGFKVDLF